MSSAGYSKKYNPHTRAVKMAADSMRDIVGTFAKDREDAPFMGQKRGSTQRRIHDLIIQSPTAMDMVKRGYSLDVAADVARAEQERA